MDKELRYQTVINPQLGLTEEDMIGKTDYDILTKEDAEELTRLKRGVLESGERKFVKVPLLAADGSLQHFEGAYIPLKQADGAMDGLIGYFRNITDRIAIEEALRKNLKRYEKAQRLGEVGNWEYDIQSETFWASDESKQIYGFSPNDNNFSIERVEGCIPERESVHQALVDLIDHDKPYHLEFDILPFNGDERKTIKSIGELVYDPLGKPLRVNGVIQNITKQKKAEASRQALERQLQQSQKLKSIGFLAGGIAHDFNNILASILGYSTLSLDCVGECTELEEMLQEIYRAGIRAKDLVKQILTFARQAEVKLLPVQASSVVLDALRLIRSLIPTTIEIRREITSDARVMADVTQLHQIVLNLCNNAAQAMEHEGGHIAVSLRDTIVDEAFSEEHEDLPAGRYVTFSVFNTGSRIPDEVLSSIFDPYFTTKEAGKGTGMGLAIVHGIVKSYKGEITVESDERGTTFTVYLPVTKQLLHAEPYEKQDLPKGDERILLVDDEAAIRRALSKILESMGYQVSCCCDGAEALALFERDPDAFDLLITDQSMPHMAGDELARRALKLRPSLPIVLCTGFSEKVSEESARAMGIKAFAYKPLRKADLARLLHQALER